MDWDRTIDNSESPYPEDRRVKYTSGDYEITREGDNYFWLRHNGKALGRGPTLTVAKAAAEQHAGRKS